MEEFKLSQLISAHAQDVKCLTAFPDVIFSGSLDKTVKLWAQCAGMYTESSAMQLGIVVKSLAHYEPSDGGNGLIFVGLQDGSITVYSPNDEKAVNVLKRHDSDVCTLFVDCRQKLLLSGSWDSKAVVWSIESMPNNANAVILDGHSLPVLAVSTIPQYDGHYLTGSSDWTIKLWRENEQVRSFTGHSDVVRSVIAFSSSKFVSCSNDGTVCLWDIATGVCTAQSRSVSSAPLLYSMSRACFTSLLFVTGSELGWLEFWSIDEQNDHISSGQKIRLPAMTIWSIVSLANGDLAVANDSNICIFTRNSSRVASSEILDTFDTLVAEKLVEEQRMAEKNVPKFGKIEKITVELDELSGRKLQLEYQRGTDPNIAAEKFLQINGLSSNYLSEIVAFICQHFPEADDFRDSHREIVTPSQRTEFNGRFWDYVFEIAVDDGRHLKLPYNVDEGADFAAERFVNDNRLPVGFLPRVASFLTNELKAKSDRNLTNNTGDPFTGADRYHPSSMIGGQLNVDAFDPFTGSSRYVPSSGSQLASSGTTSHDIIRPKGDLVPMSDYFLFTLEGSSTKTAVKLTESNQVVHVKLRLTDLQLASLNAFLASRTIVVHDGHLAALDAALCWPMDRLVPVLDIFRIALLNPDVNAYFCSLQPPSFRGRTTLSFLLALLVGDPSIALKILVCRALTNVVVHRWGRQMVLETVGETVRTVGPCLLSDRQSVQLAVSSALANLSLMLLTRTETDKVAELGPREDTLVVTLNYLDSLSDFACYSPSALVRLLQAIATLMWGDSGLISVGKRLKVVEKADKIKDALLEEAGKTVARSIVVMAMAVQ